MLFIPRSHGKIKLFLLCVFFSESAKGSDSEDDFLRQKSKAKAASDSDSDSDIGRKKRKIRMLLLQAEPYWFMVASLFTPELYLIRCS